MFYEIAGAVATGIITAVGVIAGIVWVYDNWPIWKKKKPVVKNTFGLPYDINSPLVKRFQFLAGITESYGGNLKNKRYDYNYRYRSRMH